MIVIHPGFGKTATSTLQEHLFAQHPRILNLGEPYTERTKFFETFLGKPYGRFDEAAFVAAAKDLLAGEDKTKTWVYSAATLTWEFSIRGIAPERLHRIFPEATILFTIRNQIDRAKALYAVTGRRTQSAPKPYQGRYVSPGNWIEHSVKTWDESYLGSGEYDSIIEHWETVYGKENIRILLFEDFISMRDKYVKDLCGILDIDCQEAKELLHQKHSNPRSSSSLVAYHRLREFLFPNFAVRTVLPGGEMIHRVFSLLIHKGSRLPVKIPRHWQEVLESRYGEGNRRLAERYNLPLGERGYPV